MFVKRESGLTDDSLEEAFLFLRTGLAFCFHHCLEVELDGLERLFAHKSGGRNERVAVEFFSLCPLFTPAELSIFETVLHRV